MKLQCDELLSNFAVKFNWRRYTPVISNRDYVFTRRTWKEGDNLYWAINKAGRVARRVIFLYSYNRHVSFIHLILDDSFLSSAPPCRHGADTLTL